MQRIQTPAGSSAGPQPGLLFFWADTTPLPSVFPLLRDRAEQMNYLSLPSVVVVGADGSAEDRRPHGGRLRTPQSQGTARE